MMITACFVGSTVEIYLTWDGFETLLVHALDVNIVLNPKNDCSSDIIYFNTKATYYTYVLK